MAATVTKIGGAGSTTTAQTTIVAALTAGASVGDIVFIVASIGSGKVATSVTDTKSNTWNVVQQPANGTSISENLYYSVITTALTTSDTITMSWTGTVARRAWTVGKITGLTASPLDVNPAGVTALASTSINPTTGATSTAQADEVVLVCATGHQTTTTATTYSCSGYTALDTENGGNGTTNEVSCFVAYLETSSAGTQSATVTTNQSADLAATITTFKVAAAGTTVTPTRTLMGVGV